MKGSSLTADSSKILRFEVNQEVLVCLCESLSESGHAWLVDTKHFDEAQFKKSVQEILKSRGQPDRIIAKIAGTAAGMDIVEKALKNFKIIVSSRAERGSKPLDVVFYTDTGRMRVAEIAESVELPKLTSRPSLMNEIPPATKTRPVRVLVIDDSQTIRKVLRNVLNTNAGFEVVAELPNPTTALQLLKTIEVDVITLDINMPEMDGITFLETLKGKKHPPIVMISAVNREDANRALKCFELGAVGYIEKPSNLQDEAEGEKIRSIVRTAATSSKQVLENLKSGPAILDYVSNPKFRDLIVIGASTGGTQAITALIGPFPENSPPILVVQHIPAVFSAAFAERLNQQCNLTVKEATHLEVVKSRHVYIAPGGKQMKVISGVEGLQIEVTDDPPVNRHAPSVDYLFDSVVQLPRLYRVAAALLTGMGADGARGMKSLKDKGIHTVAEAEETCVVFGMPREAIKLGGASEVAPLHKVGQKLFNVFRKLG